jgi:hypothetical protein
MPAILATWEAEIQRMVQGQPGKTFHESPYQPIPWYGGTQQTSKLLIRLTMRGSESRPAWAKE